MRTWLTLPVVVLVVAGCKDLPEIPAGVCGNQVLEPPEDCDGFERDGVPCRPPGGVNECRLDCSPDENGEAATCPSGWGCFENEVCRPATGEFVASDEAIPGNAWSLLAGDFDGNKSDDVVGLERPVSRGFTKARIHYFGSQGEPIGTYLSTKLMATPNVTDISGDSRSDLVFSYGSIHLLTGEEDRSLLTETYPSYLLGEFPARVLFIAEQLVDKKPPIVVFGRLDATDAIFVFDPNSPFLSPVVELEAGVEQLASDPTLGNLFEDEEEFPCIEFVVAYRKAAEFSVYSLCEADPEDGSLHWRSPPHVEVVRLDPPAPIEQGIVVADLDGDGHLDVIVGTHEGPYAAYGNGQELGAARPHSFLVIKEAVAPDAMPLAGGDITSDGVADLAFPGGLAISAIDPETGEMGYETTRPRYGPPWSEAIFGDLNADGFLDVACASKTGLDVDFFNGTGTFVINQFTIPTERPTEHLAIRDFDGDLVDDLAFVELPDPSSGTEQISIAFGRTSGGPEAPVPAAHLEDVSQIAAFADDIDSTSANLIVQYSQTDSRGTEQALGFLVGSSDRVPASPVELTTFSVDGAVIDSTSVALTVGSFRDPTQIDVLAFALEPYEGKLADAPPQMWLLEDIENKTHSPKYLGWTVDERTRPLGGPSADDELSARLAAKDLDGDSIDELVLVAPGDEEARCIVNVASVVGEPPVLERRDVVALDTPCYETVVEVSDLDADDAPDIVVLVGELAGTREPLVLWNDGRGGFSSEDATSLATEGEKARAFTAFRAFNGKTLFALVTERSIRLLRPLGTARAFEEELVLATLDFGSGVVAADLNGDEIIDLAVADAGSVRIFHAELEL